MSYQATDFIDFVRRAPTAFHAVSEMSRMLEEAGFARLNECEAWQLAPGGRYYLTRNGSALLALRVPEDGFAPFQIVSSHSDSPAFKLKPLAENEACGKYVRLNVERYGGMIMSTWLDRPLSIAGRAVVEDETGLHSRLVDFGRDAALIPNMPIHFNRDINSGYNFNAQVDMIPLYGDETAGGRLAQEVAACCGAKPEQIVASDLFLYNRVPGSVWGANNEYFSCGRIDDLECAYTSLCAFLEAAPQANTQVFAMFDNEEVGSSSKQGADSTLLGDVFHRVAAALGATDAQARAAMAASFMVSADNAHAVHPNHPETYDAQNRTFMNRGVVIKHSANQKYTTDAVSDAIFSRICERAGVPVQHFANRSDLLGGSTLGSIANTQVSMNTVVIGLAQLAMHSAYETAGTKDVTYMIDALRAFYQTRIEICGDGEFHLG